MSLAIAITIHDEERNIGHLLDALLDEGLEAVGLQRIVVVSSASTDGSDAIVRERESRSSLVRLVTETERRGKAAAINLALAETRDADAVVLLSGDVLPAPGAVSALAAAVGREGVGMAGGRPTPSGPCRRLAERACRLMWDLHHEVSLVSPKLGEAVAFRNVVEALPADTAVDEACLEAMIRERGLSFAYVPEAVIWNDAPKTVSDFLKQRRRIAAGHRHLKVTSGYDVATADSQRVGGIALRLLARQPQRIGTAAFTAGIEVLARLLGLWDLHVRGRNPYVWDLARSARNPAGVEADGPPAAGGIG